MIVNTFQEMETFMTNKSKGIFSFTGLDNKKYSFFFWRDSNWGYIAESRDINVKKSKIVPFLRNFKTKEEIKKFFKEEMISLWFKEKSKKEFLNEALFNMEAQFKNSNSKFNSLNSNFKNLSEKDIFFLIQKIFSFYKTQRIVSKETWNVLKGFRWLNTNNIQWILNNIEVIKYWGVDKYLEYSEITLSDLWKERYYLFTLSKVYSTTSKIYFKFSGYKSFEWSVSDISEYSPFSFTISINNKQDKKEYYNSEENKENKITLLKKFEINKKVSNLETIEVFNLSCTFCNLEDIKDFLIKNNLYTNSSQVVYEYNIKSSQEVDVIKRTTPTD